jgi:1,4-alpha-glucan branching enzyme
VDAPTLVTAAGGRDRDWTVRPQVPAPAAGDPYEVVHDGVIVGDSDVVAFARDLSVAYHVWSPTAGYPGDVWYRDFHAYGFGFGMHPSWRVTDKKLGAHDKAPYDPGGAARSVARDAAHLHGVLRDVLDPRAGALVVAAYDTELLGHWWFEGPAWLEALLRRIADDPHLETTTLAGRLERRPPTRRLHLPESSWGYAKGHASWVTTATRPMWQDLQQAVDRLQPWLGDALAPPAARVRDQAVRELAQLACSDWPFMVTRGNSPDYAFERFHHHLEAFEELVGALEAGTVPDRLAEIEERDQAPADVTAFLSAGTARSR